MATIKAVQHDSVKQKHAEILSAHLRDQRYKPEKDRICSKEVCTKTGIENRTLRSMTSGATLPSLTKFLSLVEVLPTTYLNQVLALAGYGNARILPDRIIHYVCVNRAQYELASKMQALSEAMLDGHIDHIERNELITQFEHLINMMSLFVDGLRHPTLVREAPSGSTTQDKKNGSR